MVYYIREIQTSEGVKKTAGIKARDDLECVFVDEGFHPIQIDGIETRDLNKLEKMSEYKRVYKQWKALVDSFNQGDKLIIQMPLIHHTLGLAKLFKRVKKKNVDIIVFIHDLEMIRGAISGKRRLSTRFRTRIEEYELLRSADKIVSHNKEMMGFLKQHKIAEDKLLDLGIFDYLTDEIETPVEVSKDSPIVIAGTLRPHKAGYVYNLPNNIPFNLYGTGYEGESTANVKYMGAFDPKQLPKIISGSFGLVWDGDSTSSCSGVYGEYLKINNPHKTSLYLSSGMPVIIWKKAALASFIVNNKIGFSIESIDEIRVIIDNMSDEEYEDMRLNAKQFAIKLHNGYYTKRALRNCGLLSVSNH